MKARDDSQDSCASLPATKVDPSMLPELALIFQQVRGLPPQRCARHRHAKRIPRPDRIYLGTAEPSETEQAGFESSQLDMLPERIWPRINQARFSASSTPLASLAFLSRCARSATFARGVSATVA